MECHDLIKKLEKDNAGKKATDSKRKASSASSSVADKEKCGEREKPRGFGRGLDPERIICATDSSAELTFQIKWKELLREKTLAMNYLYMFVII